MKDINKLRKQAKEAEKTTEPKVILFKYASMASQATRAEVILHVQLNGKNIKGIFKDIKEARIGYKALIKGKQIKMLYNRDYLDKSGRLHIVMEVVTK